MSYTQAQLQIIQRQLSEKREQLKSIEVHMGETMLILESDITDHERDYQEEYMHFLGRAQAQLMEAIEANKKELAPYIYG